MEVVVRRVLAATGALARGARRGAMVVVLRPWLLRVVRGGMVRERWRGGRVAYSGCILLGRVFVVEFTPALMHSLNTFFQASLL